MESLAEKIISASYDDLSRVLDNFEAKCSTKTTFEELNENELRTRFWKTLFRYISENTELSIRYSCFCVLRTLSRDKTNLEELISEERLKVVLENANLTSTNHEQQTYTNVTVESVKLLCNLIFNSTKVQQLIPTTSCLPSLLERMKTYTTTIPKELMLYDLRILFLTTALNVPTRQLVKTELNGDVCLINLLEKLYLQCQEEGDTTKKENLMSVCEVLKVLFNLYIQSDDVTIEEKERNKKLVLILYRFLTSQSMMKEDDLLSNIVNLLIVIPYDCYSPIIPAANKDCKQSYQNIDMTAISVLLTFLNRRLDSKEDLIGQLTPVVTAFIKLIKADKIIRKYVRLQILPPLKDVMKRPEEGTTLRAKLCKLLTSPVTELRDLVAEFLFILCKESVSRMVKYTGYGNAAGMFANKGLLGPNKGNTTYSSESEDSDTEEYLKHKEQINPITGCFEYPKPSPLEGMSEEQKEYEALQLVGLVDKLTRGGVIQPCRVGDDGRPKPIEHVLELQEELPKQQYIRRDSDSD